MHLKPSLDLTAEYKAIVQSIVQQYVPGVTVWIFGSRVMGTATSTSDLDIVLRTDTPVDLLTMTKLQDAFSTSMLPMRVDVLDWSALSPAMRERIEHEYIVL